MTENNKLIILSHSKEGALIIRLSEIEDFLIVKGEMDTNRFPEAGDNTLKLLTPVSYELTVRKFDDTVTVEGPLNFEALLNCSRCLDEYRLSFSLGMNVKLAPMTELPRAPELELHNEDLDVYYYEGDEIDLDPFVYEEVMLNMPVRPLCREECKGICGSCGKNRNRQPCDCHEAPSGLLGEKLKSFLN